MDTQSLSPPTFRESAPRDRWPSLCQVGFHQAISGPWNYMAADKFTNLRGCRSTDLHRGSHHADIATDTLSKGLREAGAALMVPSLATARATDEPRAATTSVARRSRRGRDPLPQLLHHQHVVHTQGCLTSAPMGQI